MDELIEKIIKWGAEKGINNPEKQFQKLAEEMLEAHEAYKDFEYTEDFECLQHLEEELGDIGVVWVLLCNMLNIKPLEALGAAHAKNKDRKGKTINGNFIKASDLAIYNNIEPLSDEDLKRINTISRLIYGEDNLE